MYHNNVLTYTFVQEFVAKKVNHLFNSNFPIKYKITTFKNKQFGSLRMTKYLSFVSTSRLQTFQRFCPKENVLCNPITLV